VFGAVPDAPRLEALDPAAAADAPLPGALSPAADAPLPGPLDLVAAAAAPLPGALGPPADAPLPGPLDLVAAAAAPLPGALGPAADAPLPGPLDLAAAAAPPVDADGEGGNRELISASVKLTIISQSSRLLTPRCCNSACKRLAFTTSVYGIKSDKRRMWQMHFRKPGSVWRSR
jgi:hypothetical protein